MQGKWCYTSRLRSALTKRSTGYRNALCYVSPIGTKPRKRLVEGPNSRERLCPARDVCKLRVIPYGRWRSVGVVSAVFVRCCLGWLASVSADGRYRMSSQVEHRSEATNTRWDCSLRTVASAVSTSCWQNHRLTVHTGCGKKVASLSFSPFSQQPFRILI